MAPHLVKCLEQGIVEAFPSVPIPSGLNTDEDLKLQLIGYDFSARSLNGTTCSSTKCVCPVYAVKWTVNQLTVRSPRVLRDAVVSLRPSGALPPQLHPRHEFLRALWALRGGGLDFIFWPAEVLSGRTALVITSLLTITIMYTGIRSTPFPLSTLHAGRARSDACGMRRPVGLQNPRKQHGPDGGSGLMGVGAGYTRSHASPVT
ncbi:hypothetical protein E2C01_015063 [Portunus trituberculatus]|uniref:Uncharacterized protein n=1 Tax=Portunus trituberculatus TaxID=210409 RepID=A0A5B7DKT9_PORTR|nr:hypothetical protein [Portunus trituberculatus]